MHKHGCAGTVHQGKRENNLLKYREDHVSIQSIGWKFTDAYGNFVSAVKGCKVNRSTGI